MSDTAKVLGIDPGKDGFLALLGKTGDPQFWPMPTVRIGKGGKRDYDESELKRIMLDANPDLIIIEKQQSFPGRDKFGTKPCHVCGRRPSQGSASTFSIGECYGLLRGLAIGIGKPYQAVHPRTWQKVVLRDVPGTDTKGRSIITAGRLFPNVDLRKSERCRKSHAGKSDSLLLAWYGMYVVLRIIPGS